MIDIHSHLLPGVDDGAKDMAEAVAMAKMAAADGITDIFLTSHLNLEFGYDPEIAAQLRADLASHCPAIRLHGGCEVHLTVENLDRVLQSPFDYTLAGSRYLLVELPDQFLWWSIRAVLERLSDAGLRLVIAHPERNPQIWSEPQIAKEMADSGYLLQVTARSLTGRFGPESSAASERLLRNRLVHFVASDAHSLTQRKPQLTFAYAHLVAGFGTETAELLTRINAAAVIADAPVKSMPASPATSCWSFVPKVRSFLGLAAFRS